MDYADPQKRIAMTCGIENCPAEYEPGTIMHTVRRKGQVVVIDHVPADVCSLCGDALPKPDTVRKTDSMLRKQPELGPKNWTTNLRVT